MEVSKERVEKAFESAKNITKVTTLIGTDIIVMDIVATSWAMMPGKHRLPGLIVRGIASGFITYGIYETLIEKQVDDVFDNLKAKAIAKMESQEAEVKEVF